jgi:DNA polymerase-3 subunit delta
MVYSCGTNDEKTIANVLGVHNYFIKDYVQTAKRFHPQEVEKILLLLHEYNLKNVGINDAGTEDAELLKELVVKMISE